MTSTIPAKSPAADPITTGAVIAGSPEIGTDRTRALRQVLGAIALPIAFLLQLVANSTYAIAVGDGVGDQGTSAQTLQFYAAHPVALNIATMCALVGSLLAIPGLLAGMKLLRGSILALVAVVLMIAGYVSYFGVNFTNWDTLALAQTAPERADVLDASMAQGTPMVFFLLFVAGNLLGTLLLGIALIGSRRVPWVAGALVIGWPVGHVTNLLVGSEWFAVAGGALEVAGLVMVASAVLRTPASDWAARG
ncbi:MAG: hypothetical protein LKI24_14515 [Acidipropionibacterium sp.]|jgi:hypothetical protein|nr:hypothetical protein [Acidipropionibacterium sp.]